MTKYDSRLRLIVEPPIRRWKDQRSLSRQAFEETFRMFERQLTEEEKSVYQGRVLYPHGYIAQEMMGSDVPSYAMSQVEATTWIKNMRNMAVFSLSTWINNVWAVDKVIALYPPQETCAVIQSDWWREYKTDDIITNFKPWMAYVSLYGLHDSTGNQDLYEGMYVAYDYFEGEVRLSLLHMTKRGTFDPFYFHEFTFKPGITLGEVVDSYRYLSPYRNYVQYAHWHERHGEVSKAGFEAMMQLSGQAMAARIFPLLIGLYGGELEIKHHTIDPQTYEYTPVDQGFPMRSPVADPVEEVDRTAQNDVSLYVIRQRKRDQATLN